MRLMASSLASQLLQGLWLSEIAFGLKMEHSKSHIVIH
jgi:hypothetical protein